MDFALVFNPYTFDNPTLGVAPLPIASLNLAANRLTKVGIDRAASPCGWSAMTDWRGITVSPCILLPQDQDGTCAPPPYPPS